MDTSNNKYSNKSFENKADPFKSSSQIGHRLIQQRKLRQKLGDVSPMWLFRHKGELPAPLLIAGRRFWREEEVDAFIERLSSERRPEEIHRPGGES